MLHFLALLKVECLCKWSAKRNKFDSNYVETKKKRLNVANQKATPTFEWKDNRYRQ